MRKFSIFLVVLGLVLASIGVVNANFDDGLGGAFSSGPLPFQDTGVNKKTVFPGLPEIENALPLSPTLGLAIKDTTVMLSWSSISGATGYKLFYAPYPNPSPIKSIDLGDKTSISATLFDGAAFYLAVQAYNSSGYSGYSNIIHFVISSSESVYDYAQDIITGNLDGDADFLQTRFSKEYLYNGEDFDCRNAINTYLFTRNTYEYITYFIHNVSEYTQDNKRLATINRTMSSTWYNQSGEGPYTSTNSGDLALIFEDEKWKAYGNQKGYQAPSAHDMVACETVENGAPVGTKTAFTQADQKVAIFSNLEDIGNGFTASMKWYRPDGSLEYEHTHVYDWGEEYPSCARSNPWIWFYYNIEGYTAFWNANQGQWRVDLYINDALVGQTYFEYKQN